MAAYSSVAIGRPTKVLNVTPEEKEKLALLARCPKSAQALAMRARIVLGCDEGVEQRNCGKETAHHRRYGV